MPSGTRWRDRGWIDVSLFGAVGDGVTDDTAAWQAGLDALAATGGGLFCPAGTSLVSAPLTIHASDVQIAGVGRASIVQAATASGHVFILGAVRGVVLRNLQIRGAATGDTTTQFGVFSLPDAGPTDCRIAHVTFADLNSGIKFDTGADRNAVVGCTFERLIGVISGTGYGVLLGAANDCLVTQNRFRGAPGHGRHAVYISGGASFTLVTQNQIRDFNEDAIAVYARAAQPACQHTQILGNTISGGGSATVDAGAISVSGKTTDTTIGENLVTGFNGWGVLVSDAGQGGLNQRTIVCGTRVAGCAFGGIVVMGGKQTTVTANAVTDNSQASLGSYNGIDIRSTSSGGLEVATDTSVIGNVIRGVSHRYALELNPSVPVPTSTVLLANSCGAGLLGTLQLNGIAAVVGGNA